MPKKQTQDIILDKGLDLRSPDEILDPGAARVLENILLDVYGVPSKMWGSVKYNPSNTSADFIDLYELIFDGGSRSLLGVLSDGDMVATTGDGVFSVIETGLSTDNYMFATARNRAYFANGIDRKSTDGSTVRELGLNPPSAAPVLTAQAGSGNIASGTYSYRISFLYDGFQESSLGPAQTVVVTNPPDNEVLVDWSGVPVPSGVTDVKVYRTLAGAGTSASHFFVGTATVGAGSLVDQLSDSNLGTPGLTDVLPLNSYPVAGPSTFVSAKHLVWMANRMFMVPFNSDRVYISDPFSPDMFREENFIRFNESDGSNITAIHPFEDGLLVFKRNNVQILRGVYGSIQSMVPDLLVQGIGCVDNRSVVTTVRSGFSEVVFADKSKLYSYNGSTFTPISEAIEPLYRSLVPVSTFVGSGEHLDTSQSDFAAGTSSPTISLASNPGTVEVVDPFKLWTTDADFNDNVAIGANMFVNNNQLSHDVGIDLVPFATFDDFETGDLSTGPKSWTINQNSATVGVSESGGAVNPGVDVNNVEISTSSSRTTGAWNFNVTRGSSDQQLTCYFMSDVAQPQPSGFGGSASANAYWLRVENRATGYDLQFGKTVNGAETVLNEFVTLATNGTFTMSVAHDGNGSWILYHNGAFATSVTDSTFTPSGFMALWWGGDGTRPSGPRVNTIEDADTTFTEDWDSAVVDATSDKTAWADFLSTEGGDPSRISYFVRTGTSVPDTTGSTFEAVTVGQDISTVTGVLDTDDFIQLRIRFTSDFVFGSAPIVFDSKARWEQSSQLEGEAIDTGVTPSGFGVFVTDDTLQANITYEMRSAATLGALSGESWTAVAPNTIPGLTANRFMQWRATIDATDGVKPTILSVKVQWLTGDVDVKRMQAIYHDDLLIITGKSQQASAGNDIWLIQDRFGRWTTADYQAATLSEFFGALHFGDVTVGKVLKVDEDVFTREGASVTSTIETGNKSWVEEGLADNRKLLRGVRVSTPSSEDLLLSADPDEAGFIADITDSGSNSRYYPINTNAIRHKIRVKHSGTNDFKLWKISPEVHVYPLRKGAQVS